MRVDRYTWILGALLLSPGKAQFDLPIPIPCTGCLFPLITDLDGLNGPDLLFAEGNNLQWMSNDGSGVFTGPMDLSINPGFLRSELAADLDGDADIDVVGIVTGFEGTVVWIMRNDDPGFTAIPIDTVQGVTRPPSRAVDLDGDEDLDLLGVDQETGELWYRNNGDGSYTSQLVSNWCASGVRGPYCPIDVEGDGDTDLVGYADPPGKLIVHWNLGGARFGPFTMASSFLGHSPAGIALDAVDVDDDGFADVVAGGRALLSSGYGTFAGSGGFLEPGLAQSVGNIDCDDALEVFFSRGAANDIYYDLESGILSDPGLSGSAHSALADLNGDGLLDLISDAGEGGSLIWRADTSIAPPTTLELPWDTLFTLEPIELEGGDPTEGGGVYSGAGVFDDIFHPLIAGPGNAVITYTYSTFNGFTSCVGIAVDTVFVADLTGIREQAFYRVIVHPNPATDQLHLHTDHQGPLDLVIHDMSGRRVLTRSVVAADPSIPVVLRLSELQAGCYQLSLLDKGLDLGSARFMISP